MISAVVAEDAAAGSAGFAAVGYAIAHGGR
jgi:hypothetical protein